MGTKNNPKNRSGASKNKVIGGKECEPVVFYDFDRKIRYLSAKVTKTNDVICGGDGFPLRWKEIVSE